MLVKRRQPYVHMGIQSGSSTDLFRFAFVISFRKAGPSRGFKSSKAHKSSSETLREKSARLYIRGISEQTSCMRHNYRTLIILG